MAIEWGGWDYGSGNGMRVGIEYEVTSPNNGSSSCTFTYDIWTENQYKYNDNGQKLSYSDDIGGSTTFNNTSGGDPVRRATKTFTYNYPSSSYGSSPGTSTATAKLSGTYNGVTPSRSITHSIPTRPYATPAAPSNCKSSRNSDTSATISWTRNATTGKPYDAIWVERYVYGYVGWTRVASISGGATSWTDNSITANRTYAWRVQADNSAGTSGYAQTADQLFTTPAAPTSPLRTQVGADQVLTWAADIGYTQHATEIWRSVNGTYSLLASVGSGVKTYTDSTSSAATKVKYKFRTVCTSGPTLYSAYSADTTETVGVTTPPAAPTNLKPSSGTLDETDSIIFTWTHNSTDTTAQTAFQVQYRYQGGSTWTSTGKITGIASTWTMPPNTVTKGKVVEWQVQTWGALTTTASPYSASAFWSTSPVIAIKYPVAYDPPSGRTEALSKGFTPWGTARTDGNPDLGKYGVDSTLGQPIYMDINNVLRAQPIVIPSSAATLQSDPGGAYPVGSSVMSLSAAQAAANGWPNGESATVVTFRRVGDTDANAVVQQWWYPTGGVFPRVMFRRCNAGTWSAWVFAIEDTGWINVTPVSGTGTCRYRCRNGIVSLNIALSGVASIAVNTVGTLLNAGQIPAAYCPDVAVYSAGSAAGSGMNLGVFNAPSPGSVQMWNPVYNTGATTTARLTFTYMKEI